MKRHLLLALTAMLLLAGCNNLTQENYNKVKTGMHYDEVVSILGKPESCSEALGLMSCEWKDGDAEVAISFIAKKVTITTGSGLK